MLTNVEGIVLRQIKFQESDKILTIFSKQQGKIQAIAKGARKPKSALMSSTQVFCYSNFILYKGKSFYHINQSENLNSFYKLREDIIKLSYGTFIMELIESGIVEDEPNERLFELLVKTLEVLCNMEDSYLKLVLAFQLKYISFLGYKPQLKNCVLCNNQPSKRLKFSYVHGGILCEDCFDKEHSRNEISSKILNTMEELLYCHLDEVHKLKISNDILLKVEKLLLGYITTHLEKKEFKALEFIKSLQKK